jgi:hypothetical protein
MNVPTQITENFDNAAKTIVDTNDRVLDTVVSVNQRIVDTVVEVADRAPSFDVPFSGKFPTPAEAGKQYLDFVERAASMNRDFTARIVGQLPTGVATTAKASATKAAKPATKAASKKATTRK